MPDPRTTELENVARTVKRRFLTMYKTANAGHVGSALSCAELLVFARHGLMRATDHLVLSKGHAAAALYATLAEAGDFPVEALETFYKDGTQLAAHPPPGGVPGIPFATGSLGHGLSLAAGLAYGARLQDRDDRVYCVTSDGELDAGSTWEAALFVAQHRLDNLVWLIDRNGLQGFGRTEEVMALEPLAAKLESFGWCVASCDGHDFASLRGALDQTRAAAAGRPTVLVARTVKGRGLGALEDTVDCHYRPMSDETYAALMRSLES